MKSIRVLVVTIFLLIIISAGTLLALAYYFNSSTDELSTDIVVFQVDKGASFNGIATDLEDAQLIRSALFLKVFNKITGSRRPIL